MTTPPIPDPPPPPPPPNSGAVGEWATQPGSAEPSTAQSPGGDPDPTGPGSEWMPQLPWTAPPPPPGGPGSRRPNRRPLLIASALVTVVALLGGATWWVVGRDDPGPDHPDSWDPRVADLVEFVERERDLDFATPVYVDFLEEDAFLDEIRSDDSELSAADEAARDLDSERFLAMFRAIGLIEGDVDLAAESEALTDAGTLAFYRFSDERIVIRGTTLDLATKVTVVHELTHALQDQHFDLDALNEQSADEFAGDPTALIEGDAERIEGKFVSDLSAADLRKYQRQLEGQVDDDAFDDIPLILQLAQGAPYAFGPPFVQILESDDGNDAVDAAFRDPPESDEHYFDPASFDRGTVAKQVDEFPELDAEATVVQPEDEFGSTGWLLMLGEQIDSRDAIRAALGWGGDRFRAYEVDGTVCVQIRYVGDTRTDTDEMSDALDEWRDALPFRDDVEIVRKDSYIEIESCDPGPDVDRITTERSELAFTREVARLQMISGLIEDDLGDLEDATCAADAMATSLSDDDLTAEELSPRGVAQVRRAMLGCDLGSG